MLILEPWVGFSGGSKNQKRGVPRVGRNTMRCCARGTRSIVTYYCELERGFRGTLGTPLGSATGIRVCCETKYAGSVDECHDG